MPISIIWLMDIYIPTLLLKIGGQKGGGKVGDRGGRQIGQIGRVYRGRRDRGRDRSKEGSSHGICRGIGVEVSNGRDIPPSISLLYEPIYPPYVPCLFLSLVSMGSISRITVTRRIRLQTLLQTGKEEEIYYDVTISSFMVCIYSLRA